MVHWHSCKSVGETNIYLNPPFYLLVSQFSCELVCVWDELNNSRRWVPGLQQPRVDMDDVDRTPRCPWMNTYFLTLYSSCASFLLQVDFARDELFICFAWSHIWILHMSLYPTTIHPSVHANPYNFVNQLLFFILSSSSTLHQEEYNSPAFSFVLT